MHVRFRSFVVGSLAVMGVGLFGSSFVTKAHADSWDKKTIVTVNESIIAGNKVLAPGTYVWRLMDSPSNRHIVQIFDQDQKHLEATILAIPNYRLKFDGKSQFTFWETPTGVPKAVRAWFYPGDNSGQEFAFPKKLVAQLASAVPVPVPAAYYEAPTPAPEPSRAASAPEPVAAPEPAASPAPVPQAEPEPQPQPAPAAPAAQALPHTASLNPLIGLGGLVLISLAGLLTLAEKR